MNSINEFLKTFLIQELSNYYKDPNQVFNQRAEKLVERWGNDETFNEEHRYLNLSKHADLRADHKILDMAAGCGSFVLQGLKNGYDVYGIEPENWKQDLITLKFDANQYPFEWRTRIEKGIGEDLPFGDGYFDRFDSWQTFEHVQDIKQCLSELYRVLKDGGKGIIRCPSYCTFYEGHYQLFWFPMMGKGVCGRIYLKLRNRPTSGLNTFNPINHKILMDTATKSGFIVTDLDKKQIFDKTKSRFPRLSSMLGTPILKLVYIVWSTKEGIKRFGKSEKSIHLLLEKR